MGHRRIYLRKLELMPKKIDVQIKGFEGSVTFFEPLFLEQVLAIEDAQDAAAEQAPPSALLTKLNELSGKVDDKGEVIRVTWSSRVDKHFIPAICKSVEKWEIAGLPEKVTPETFPMSPRSRTIELINFLFGELVKIYSGEIDVPNES